MRGARHEDHRVVKGMVAGMIGGFVASWTMNQFQSVTQKLEQASKNSAQPREVQDQENSQDSEDATMKTADRIAVLVAHRHLTKDELKIAGPIVHYAYGTLLGGLYGALAEVTPEASKGAGAAYGAAVWLIGDEIAVPRLGLSGPPTAYPLRVHAKALAAHLVYGVTTEVVRRGIRAAL